MLAVLGEIRDRSPQDNVYQCDARVARLQHELAALPKSAPARQRFALLYELGDLGVLLGAERAGIAVLEQAEELAKTIEGGLRPEVEDELLLRLGAAWLRVGETENCCASNTPQSCIIPLAGPALHAKPEGSKKAIEYFDRVIARPGAGEFARLQAIWLRNIAAMTLGEWPDGVPEGRRVPPEYFAPGEEFPRFENVAGALGVDVFGNAGGVVAEDFDGDGDIDLLVSNFDPAGQLRYFRNAGDGTFDERTDDAGLTGLFGGLNMVQADYDGDGLVDVLVLRGAWLGRNGRHPKSLLRNEGDGTFTDRTFEAGLAGADYPSQTAAWADFDNDGDLDLYIGNETVQGLDAPCQLFVNDGNGSFAERAADMGVTNGGFTKGVVAADFDGDRLPDIYVSNLGQPNRLYRNCGKGGFEDVAAVRGVTAPVNGFPAFAWDFDQDGNLDILALPFYVTIGDLVTASLGKPTTCDVPHLYRGDGRGNFEDMAARCGISKPCSPMGANFGDLDNDGFPDVYLGTGTPTTRAIMPNLLWHNRGGRDFTDVTLPSGMGHLQKGHAIAFADFDDDGDLDVFEEMGGAYRGDKFRSVLYVNPGFGNHWLAVRCVGVKSNTSAIGARIRAEIVEDGARRSVWRWVGSGGSFGASPLRQHLGLGKATKVETLEVFWPATNTTQTFKDVAVDQVVTVTEGEERLATRTLTPKRLGGAAK
jgi:hypothetical protein